MRAVPFTHSGSLHVQVKRLLGKKKWQSRYVVISQGCLYVYEDKNAKHTENAYTIKQFESVKDFDADSDESFCFCIKYEIPTKKPLIFASDTYTNRTVWINEVEKAIQEVQQFSADSGFGSAGTFPPRDSGYASGGVFPSRDSSIPDEADHKGYDEIPEWHIKTASPRPIQESLDTLTSSPMLSVRTGSTERTVHTDDRLVPIRTSDSRFHGQNQDSVYANTGPRNVDHLSTLSMASLKEDINNDSLYINTGSSTGATQAIESLPSTTSSLLSVSGDTESVDEESCNSETVPKTVYESPEEDVDTLYANAQFFKTTDYYCASKKNGRSKLQTKPIGTFLVSPGETTKLDLCVKTSNGDISFRIYEQNGRISLFKTFSMECCIFPTLDALLRYYHVYELPSKTFKVKLKKGLNIAA
ncbi:uncharacterized protein LOC123557388 isoform X2 [Mercenaria mercenaria]|nr:uncharacterized protein LOC123557388 isoform X2 [Mercenaria mercenaria]